MASQVMENYRENAEVYHGEKLCKEKSMELLEGISMPKGLLPLDEITEVGYNRSAGFVWLKQKKKKEHRFRAINKMVAYDSEVTAFVENHRMKKLTGVKSKEFLFWATISDIYISDPSSGKISFANPTGLYRSFPISAFEIEEDNEGDNKRDDQGNN